MHSKSGGSTSHYQASNREKITLIVPKKEIFILGRGASENTSKQPTHTLWANSRSTRAGRPEHPGKALNSAPANNKPRRSPDHESSQAILITATSPSGHW